MGTLRSMILRGLIGTATWLGAVTPARAQTELTSYQFNRLSTPPIRKTVQNWTDLRQQNVVIQTRDYSCGAAALATVLQFYFQDQVTENQILESALARLNAEEVADRQENGLSLDDLFIAAQELGYLGAVIRLPLEKIPQLPAPVIVRIERENFKHFVVLKGSLEDRIFIADPLRGNLRLPAHEFVKQWSGEALVLGKPGFGLPNEHPLSIQEVPPIRNELSPMRRWLIRSVRPVK